jgi:uncharacterized coiled-coil protein SlyX
LNSQQYLKARIEELVSKVKQQEEIITQQSASIASLESQIATNRWDLISTVGQVDEVFTNFEKKMSAQESLIDKLKTPNPKTCDTILQSDPSKESGMYWIDPDGQSQLTLLKEIDPSTSTVT